MRLTKNPASVWQTYYETAEQWYEENGNLKHTKELCKLSQHSCSWMHTLRRRVKSGNISGNLTWEKIESLNDMALTMGCQ